MGRDLVYPWSVFCAAIGAGLGLALGLPFWGIALACGIIGLTAAVALLLP